ncbi:hypothetical protein FJR04_02255 [Anabaena sp. UHCC 0204]|nr:hypothetical protein [Anabaena sp. UHCC 0204]
MKLTVLIAIAPLLSLRPIVISLNPLAKASISDPVISKLLVSVSSPILIFCPDIDGCISNFPLPVTELSTPNKFTSFAVRVRLLFPAIKLLLKAIVPVSAFSS